MSHSSDSDGRGRFWSAFGPGLLWAASAIGVSHLVQSTRAGAVAGFGLASVILLAVIFKYPFFDNRQTKRERVTTISIIIF